MTRSRRSRRMKTQRILARNRALKAAGLPVDGYVRRPKDAVEFMRQTLDPRSQLMCRMGTCLWVGPDSLAPDHANQHRRAWKRNARRL